MKTKMFIAGALLCAALALFCGVRIYQHYAQAEQYEKEFEALAKAVEQSKEEPEEKAKNEPDEAVRITAGGGSEPVLSDYRTLAWQNPDLAGWLSIAGTGIDYPVMYAPDKPDYYLTHNFNQESSGYGVPYIAEDCDPYKPSTNVIIYGHHIKNGQMFGALESYTDPAFYEEHKRIQFDTLSAKGEYVILAVFRTTVYDGEGFPYYDFVDAENEDAFDDYLSKCRELALYDTGEHARYGDYLLTLSTCEYSRKNGRLVVVAKRV